jgi:hypothetical protein
LRAPLLPLLALPELKISMPLLPLDPEFVLRMVTMPLLVVMPSPLLRLKAPPVLSVLRPEKA